MVQQELDEKQHGFPKGRMKTDGIIAISHLAQKRLEKPGNMTLGFADLIHQERFSWPY